MLGSYRGFGAASEPLDLGNLRSSCPPKSRPVATDQRERMVASAGVFGGSMLLQPGWLAMSQSPKGCKRPLGYPIL